ncbi:MULTISPECIES: methyltransferase domain-containing protein [Nocardiopsidaceae]|uniref:Methyltransferase domain-containing protein n=1 Tax=Streptomonospora nanhaiensis TaxID=1323731 RepID=A0ABY6YV85_9ACTN|nr:methyltransferase domain-containing protein [Streptomonospora nanhaiensis]WAE75989.1 methyltransferase domain-containing protein [Streptomonospora nanhaiensis]
MFVSARSFEEYRAMFSLSDHDLSLRILDCPGGAAGFVAEAGARGADAVAVDPQYGPGREGLGELALRENEHKHAELVERAGEYDWSWFGGPARYTRMRSRSARAFGADVAARPGRYVAGSLPDLPFADRSFDLVLSSHLLFSYGEQLGEGWHRDALLELVRVSRGQVRLYPLFQHTSNKRYPALERMRESLAECGVPSRVERVDYAFAPGDPEMLVLECAGARAPAGASREGGGTSAAFDPVRWRHLEAER